MIEEILMATKKDQPVVGLFVTCLVDSMRPSVGMAAVKRLKPPAAGLWCRKPDLLRPAGLEQR